MEAERVDEPERSPDPEPALLLDDGTRVRALSVSEAALLVERHESTLRRYLQVGRFPNAYRGPDDSWRIPVVDLLGEGLLSRAADDDDGSTIVAELEVELERQQAENAELRRRLAVAEHLAGERADRIRELRLSLRMLLGTEPLEDDTASHGPEARPLVWSGEIALKDG